MANVYVVLQGVQTKLGNGDVDCTLYEGNNYQTAYNTFVEERDNTRGWMHKSGDSLITLFIQKVVDNDGDIISGESVLLDDYVKEF